MGMGQSRHWPNNSLLLGWSLESKHQRAPQATDSAANLTLTSMAMRHLYYLLCWSFSSLLRFMIPQKQNDKMTCVKFSTHIILSLLNINQEIVMRKLVHAKCDRMKEHNTTQLVKRKWEPYDIELLVKVTAISSVELQSKIFFLSSINLIIVFTNNWLV